MNLTKIHSITKKITVALLGGFLLIFILFHACANLCILRNDDGAWYSAFCHFMGTNYIVKVVEVFLLLFIFAHICITLWLAYTNYKARGSVRYHHRSRTKTHSGSKLMMWTGILIFCLLIVHFFHFYFVKLDIVPGEYMVKTEELNKVYKDKDFAQLVQMAQMYRADPKEIISDMREQNPEMAEEMEKYIPVLNFMEKAGSEEGMLSEDGKWIKKINKEEKSMLKECVEGIDVEPDFYTMARKEFKNPLMVILYLVFFVVLFIHMRHGFPSVFQTLGLNNYKYNKFLDAFGLVYAIVVCLMFTVTVLGVLFFV